MIIFGVRNKILSNNSQDLPYTCSYCQRSNTTVAYRKFNYFHIFWIPFIPYGFQIITVCNHCKKVSYQKELAPNLVSQIKGSMPNKIPLGYYTGILLLGVFILVIIILNLTKS